MSNGRHHATPYEPHDTVTSLVYAVLIFLGVCCCCATIQAFQMRRRGSRAASHFKEKIKMRSMRKTQTKRRQTARDIMMLREELRQAESRLLEQSRYEQELAESYRTYSTGDANASGGSKFRQRKGQNVESEDDKMELEINEENEPIDIHISREGVDRPRNPYLHRVDKRAPEMSTQIFKTLFGKLVPKKVHRSDEEYAERKQTGRLPIAMGEVSSEEQGPGQLETETSSRRFKLDWAKLTGFGGAKKKRVKNKYAVGEDAGPLDDGRAPSVAAMDVASPPPNLRKEWQNRAAMLESPSLPDSESVAVADPFSTPLRPAFRSPPPSVHATPLTKAHTILMTPPTKPTPFGSPHQASKTLPVGSPSMHSPPRSPLHRFASNAAKRLKNYEKIVPQASLSKLSSPQNTSPPRLRREAFSPTKEHPALPSESLEVTSVARPVTDGPNSPGTGTFTPAKPAALLLPTALAKPVPRSPTFQPATLERPLSRAPNTLGQLRVPKQKRSSGSAAPAQFASLRRSRRKLDRPAAPKPGQRRVKVKSPTQDSILDEPPDREPPARLEPPPPSEKRKRKSAAKQRPASGKSKTKAGSRPGTAYGKKSTSRPASKRGASRPASSKGRAKGRATTKPKRKKRPKKSSGPAEA